MPVREAELAPIEAPKKANRTKTLTESDAAHRRVEDHKWLFERDWLPFIKGVHLLSMEAWESFPAGNRPTNLDGTPDWTDHDLQQEFAALSEGRSWADYFTGRGKLLARMRYIGQVQTDFMAWYNQDENEKLRETSNFPTNLWSKYQASIKEPDADPEPADPADPNADPEPNADPYPEDPKEPTETEAEISQVEALSDELQVHLDGPDKWAICLRTTGEDLVNRSISILKEMKAAWLALYPERPYPEHEFPMKLLYALENPDEIDVPLIPDEVAPPTVGTALIKLPKVKKQKSAGKGAPKGIKKAKAKTTNTKKPIRKKK